MAILFTLRVLTKNLQRGNRRRNTFCILILCLAWDSNPGFLSSKPTHYLLDHGDFSACPIEYFARVIWQHGHLNWRWCELTAILKANITYGITQILIDLCARVMLNWAFRIRSTQSRRAGLLNNSIYIHITTSLCPSNE